MARHVDQEKRAEILQAAFAFLRQQGSPRVTMTELARALGMKRSTLYWYFPDVASIFDAALDALFIEQDRFVSERIAGLSHPIDVLGAYLQAVHAFYAGRDDEIVFMFQFWAAGRPEAPDLALSRIRARYLPRREQAIALLRAGVESGQVRPCDPEALIGLVGAMIDGLLIQRQVTGAALAPIHAIIQDMLLAPLKVEPPTETMNP